MRKITNEQSVIQRSAIAFLVPLLLIITACGGGGGGDSGSSTSTSRSSSSSSSEPTEISMPTGFVGEALAEGNQIRFSWNMVTGAQNYVVYYATEPNIAPENINSFDNNGVITSATTSVVVSNLTNGVTYYAVVAALASDDTESDPSTEINVLVQEHIEGYSYWPTQTGITWCADVESSSLACPIAEFPKQDGDYLKVERQIVKLSNEGEPLDDDATDWSCMQDATTGLIWEVKVDDEDHLRHYSHTYGWYQSTGYNGGNAGNSGNNTHQCVGECNTEAYIEAVNATELCGFTDWRLPSPQELMSLADMGDMSFLIDEIHASDASSAYWTHLSSISDSEWAWWVRLGTSEQNPLSRARKQWEGSVRLVHGAKETTEGDTSCTNKEDEVQATTPTADFAINDNGTVIHKKTGLMWSRCNLGETWDQIGETCQGSAEILNWQEALQAANESEYAGYDDWRLPDLHQLLSIVEQSCWNPSINTTIFPGSYQSMHYWTASPTLTSSAVPSGLAWVVNFSFGNVNAGFKNGSTFDWHVRLVRQTVTSTAQQ